MAHDADADTHTQRTLASVYVQCGGTLRFWVVKSVVVSGCSFLHSTAEV